MWKVWCNLQDKIESIIRMSLELVICYGNKKAVMPDDFLFMEFVNNNETDRVWIYLYQNSDSKAYWLFSRKHIEKVISYHFANFKCINWNIISRKNQPEHAWKKRFNIATILSDHVFLSYLNKLHLDKQNEIIDFIKNDNDISSTYHHLVTDYHQQLDHLNSIFKKHDINHLHHHLSDLKSMHDKLSKIIQLTETCHGF